MQSNGLGARARKFLGQRARTHSAVHVKYNDHGGITRVLELKVPEKSEANRWVKGLKALLQVVKYKTRKGQVELL